MITATTREEQDLIERLMELLDSLADTWDPSSSQTSVMNADLQEASELANELHQSFQLPCHRPYRGTVTGAFNLIRLSLRNAQGWVKDFAVLPPAKAALAQLKIGDSVDVTVWEADEQEYAIRISKVGTPAVAESVVAESATPRPSKNPFEWRDNEQLYLGNMHVGYLVSLGGEASGKWGIGGVFPTRTSDLAYQEAFELRFKGTQQEARRELEQIVTARITGLAKLL